MTELKIVTGVLAKRTRDLLAIRGFSIQSFSNHHGFSPNTISKILNGRANPRLSTLAEIADALECDLYIDLVPHEEAT